MRSVPPDAFEMCEDFGRSSATRLTILPGVDDVALLLGEHRPNAPVPLKAPKTGRRNDLIFSTSLGIVAVSPRWVQCVQDAGLTGWSLYDIAVTGAGAEAIEEYRGLSIIGRCGPPVEGAAERVMAAPGPNALPMPHLRGIHPVPNSWDGSDFFIPRETYCICVSARTVEAYQSGGLRGVIFNPLSTVLIPTL